MPIAVREEFAVAPLDEARDARSNCGAARAARGRQRRCPGASERCGEAQRRHRPAEVGAVIGVRYMRLPGRRLLDDIEG